MGLSLEEWALVMKFIIKCSTCGFKWETKDPVDAASVSTEHGRMHGHHIEVKDDRGKDYPTDQSILES